MPTGVIRNHIPKDKITMIYKTLHRKLWQHEPQYKPVVNKDAPEE